MSGGRARSGAAGLPSGTVTPYEAVNRRIAASIPSRAALGRAGELSSKEFSPWEIMLYSGVPGALASGFEPAQQAGGAMLPVALWMSMRRPIVASTAGRGFQGLSNLLQRTSPAGQAVVRMPSIYSGFFGKEQER